MEIQLTPEGKIRKVYLSKEDRCFLTSMIKLPKDLREMVAEHELTISELSFFDRITEKGIPIAPGIPGFSINPYFPIVWLNHPTDCHRHVQSGGDLKVLFRWPAKVSVIPYDFPRVLVYKAVGRAE